MGAGYEGARASYLAVDLGASSGRVMAGWLDDDGKIRLEEVHRFENVPVEDGGRLRWDFEGLMGEIFVGLERGIRGCREAGRPVRSIGVDSWAVDFGLIDERGELTGPVVHYRDGRTEGQMEKVFGRVPQRELFHRTGIQFLPFNTVYQLCALKEIDPGQLERAGHLMMIADLVAWRLTGRVATEYTNATTTQLFEAEGQEWSWEVIGRLGLPAEIFPEVLRPGALIGNLRRELGERWEAEDVRVVAVATHDTASAVAAVPARAGEPVAYLSCGTWSLLGTELNRPILTEDAFAANFTNEGGAAGTFRFLKNIMGLWILQECRRQWKREGKDFAWGELETMARRAAEERGEPLPLFDVDHDEFLPPGNMADRVKRACVAVRADLAQADEGVITAIVLRSLAAKYRDVFWRIEDLTLQRFERLYVVGGGVQNGLLLEWTAEAIGREVVAGPVEATALGNVGIQMISAGGISDLKALRSAVARVG